MQNKWFKNKNYGYGWYPASWQGWVVLAVYVILLTYLIKNFLPNTNSKEIPPELWWYLAKVFGLTIVLIIIARITGEKPEWRWGGKK